ncbi:PxKF domain-containing protein [Kribbella sp. NPDC023855]|uniref:PxKF domain-containing protein n=1 Tax=Kribbella sp. NPDC023855 TaxID=3154698 RepID=UPI0033C505A4
MSQHGKLTRQAVLATGIAATAALVLAGIAHADNITDEIDGGASLTLVAGDASSVGQTTVQVVANANDGTIGCNINSGESLTISLVTPAGVTATPASLTFTDCEAMPVSFKAAAGAVGGTVTATITGNATGGPNSDFKNNVAIPITIQQQPVVVSHAPVAGILPADANGAEGSALSTHGSFTDEDVNDTLAITKVSGLGTVTDNGNGTWSWSHTTTDDAAGTVVVQVTDGTHAAVTETFDWTASNVAPSIGQVTSSRLGACEVSVNAPFTDPGSADTHSTVINWGDGNSSTFDPATSPSTGSHTFAANGNYTIGVTVTDDDAGSDTAAAAASFATKNTPSALMQPINATGTKSVFKLGSTIPVKIIVTGCDGNAVATLTPAVALSKVDAVADAVVNEPAIETVSTNGLAMRWSDPQYIYNLSTKLSQHTGAALTAGTYRVTVSDSSFTGPVSALFDLRK